MPRFACPDCRAVVTATEEQRETVISCPDCGRKLRVPPAKSAPPPPAETPSKEGVTRQRPAARDDEDDSDDRRRRVRADDDERDRDEEAPRRRGKKVKENHTPIATAGGVLSGLGGLVLLVGFILLITGKWVPLVWEPIQAALEGMGVHPLLAIGITFGIIMVPVGLFWAASTRSTILDAMPNEVDFRPARREEFPDLDVGKLRSYTEAFEALGFRRVKDYSLVTDLDNGLSGFGRLMLHPDEGCFAEINQVFRGDSKATPMRCNLSSALEDGWSLGTGDRQPTKESYIMRRPRAAWQCLPGESPEELFAEHLALRRKMERDLGIAPLAEDTAEDYFDRERASNQERKDAVRKRSGLTLLVTMWLFEKSPKHQWLGEYASAARRNKKKRG